MFHACVGRKPADVVMSPVKALYDQGVTHDYHGELERAIRCYSEVLRLDPNAAEAHNNIGINLLRLGRPDEAERHLRAALGAERRNPEALHNLGVVMAAKGRLDEAIALYEEGLALKPTIS